MDATVTARVPVEVKEQGNALLKSLGSSPTQLINSAYRYLLKEGRLPEPESERKAKKRRLSAAQRKELAQSLEAMYLGSLETEDARVVSSASVLEDAGTGVADADANDDANTESYTLSFKERLNAARDDRYAHSS